MSLDLPRTTVELAAQTANQVIDAYYAQLCLHPELTPEEFLQSTSQAGAEMIEHLYTVRLLHQAARERENRPASQLPFSRLGDFEVQRVLGRGGMGIVLLARQMSLDRLVALKVLSANVAIHSMNRQRFQLEAHVAGSLQHPNIVQVYAVGNENEVDYYAMQFIDGPTVAQLLASMRSMATGETVFTDSTVSRKVDRTKHDFSTNTSNQSAWELLPAKISRFSPRQVAEIGAGVADALHAAHLKGIIHRDVKPSNILLDTNSKPYLSDFGLAHVEQDLQLTGPGVLLGSLRYMSPEQLEPEDNLIDARCDVYGLGVSLYEMLTLEPAVHGQNRRQVLNSLLQHKIVPPRRLCTSIPKDLETIVLKALSPNRDQRYASAAALATDLRAFLEHRPIAAKRNSLPVVVSHWMRRNPWTAAVSAAFLLLLIASSIASTIVAVRLDRLSRQLRQSLQQSEQQRARATALSEFLIDAFRSPDPALDGRSFTVASMLDTSAEKLLKDQSLDEQARGDLLDAIGQSLRGLGAFPEAERVHQACYDLRLDSLGPTALPSLQSMLRLALAKRDVSNLSESIALYQQALALLREHYGDDHEDTLEAIGALAMAYQDDMQLDQAEPLQRESLQRRTRVLGPEHPATLQAMNNLALWKQESGLHEEAYKLFSEACQMRQRILTKRHPDSLQAMANLSGAMQDLGLLSEALALQEETLLLHREVLGDTHPNTLIALNNTALLYADTGQLESAVGLFEEVLAAMRKKLGDTHQDTLIAMGNLCYFYTQQKRLVEAKSLALERLAAETASRGAEHLVVATCHSMLAAILFEEGDLPLAAEHFRQALHIRQQQPESWSTYREMSRLGEVLLMQSMLPEAEQMLLSSYQNLQRLAEEIPSSARSRIMDDAAMRLVQLYEALGQPESAERFRPDRE